MNSTPNKRTPELNIDTENESPNNVVRVAISTPPAAASKEITPTSDELAAAGRRISVPTVATSLVEESSSSSSDEEGFSKNNESGGSMSELESLREQLQQALDDKAELIEESLLDKERIKDQKETIELLTKRIREFEMSRPTAAVGLSLPAPSRTRSATSMAANQHIKQLGEDNIQLAREVDRLITERDKLEKKLIDIKIKYANGYLTRQNSGASTEDELDNETNIFSTLSVDEKLRRKKAKQRVLGVNSSATKSSVFSAARNWFSRSKRNTNVLRSVSSIRPNEVHRDSLKVGVAV